MDIIQLHVCIVHHKDSLAKIQQTVKLLNNLSLRSGSKGNGLSNVTRDYAIGRHPLPLPARQNTGSKIYELNNENQHIINEKIHIIEQARRGVIR